MKRLRIGAKEKRLLRNMIVVIPIFIGCYFLFGISRASLLNNTPQPDMQYWRGYVEDYLKSIKWLEQSWLDPLKENNITVLLIGAIFVIIIMMILIVYYDDIWRFLKSKVRG